jgi:hypothetical protein
MVVKHLESRTARGRAVANSGPDSAADTAANSAPRTPTTAHLPIHCPKCPTEDALPPSVMAFAGGKKTLV